MKAAHLQRRILVVVVTTRAAANSLRPGDGHARAAVQRGIDMLDGMTDEVARDGDRGTRDQLVQAKLELASMLGDGSN
jgi:hypothetical protein